MEKLNQDIDRMYKELTDKELTVPDQQKSFNFSSIRDNFRLHIHNRMNSTSQGNVFDQQMVENLIALKKKSFELLQAYKNINESSKISTTKTFTSIDEFVAFVSAQQDLINLELWKVEAISNYLEQLKLKEMPSQSINDSFGI